jgi:hypothetical protein
MPAHLPSLAGISDTGSRSAPLWARLVPLLTRLLSQMVFQPQPGLATL